MTSRPTHLAVSVAAIAALSAAGLTACVRETEITVDGLPVTNAASHIRQVDGLWRSHLTSQPVTPATTEDSACFYLMYDNVALNSIVCGPVFWLGDSTTSWDYYPLETVLSADGRSLQAVARRNFMRDYPMSAADALFRPDNALPNLAAELTEPAAPVASEPVLHLDGLPEDRRVTADLTFESPVHFHTSSVQTEDGADDHPSAAPGATPAAGDGTETEGAAADGADGDVVGSDPTAGPPPEATAECTTLRRVIWSSHVGEGAEVIAAPEGHQFVTIVSTPGCAVEDLLLIDGAEPALEDELGPRLVVDGTEVPAPGWAERGSFVVPGESPEEALLTSTLFGTEVYVDLLTGATDPVTESLTETMLESPIPDASGSTTGIEGRWDVGAAATGRPFQNPGGDAEAVLARFLPQFGLPPEGERWLVVGLTLTFDLRDSENPSTSPGEVRLSANLEDSGRMVRLIDAPGGEDPRVRRVTAIVSVPESTRQGRLTVEGTLVGWSTAGAGGTSEAPDAVGSVAVDLTFPEG
nr:hypothetical protein [Actinomycetales bacterium]